MRKKSHHWLSIDTSKQNSSLPKTWLCALEDTSENKLYQQKRTSQQLSLPPPQRQQLKWGQPEELHLVYFRGINPTLTERLVCFGLKLLEVADPCWNHLVGGSFPSWFSWTLGDEMIGIPIVRAGVSTWKDCVKRGICKGGEARL